MKLLELFDKSVKAHWADISEVGGHAEFIIGRERYWFMISEFEVGQDYEVPAWHVEFALVTNQGMEQRYDNTGTGNQYPLYATILQLIKEYTSQYGERVLVFGADDAGRKTLYARLMTKFLKGWTIVTTRKDVVAFPPGQEVVPAL